MGKSLLEKSRELNKMVRQIPVHPKKPDFEGAAMMMAENLECNVYILGRRGMLRGWAFRSGQDCVDINTITQFSERFPGTFNQKFLDVQETEVNIPLPAGSCIFKADDVTCHQTDRMAAVVPIYGGAGRMGTFSWSNVTGHSAKRTLLWLSTGLRWWLTK